VLYTAWATQSKYVMKMIKIFHLISTLDTGGAELFLSRLVARADKGRFENIVVSMTDIGNVGEKIASAGIPVYSLEMKKGLPDPVGIIRLIKQVRKFQPDIIQCWMYHANLLGLLMKLFFYRVKIIWNIRCSNMDFANYGIVYELTVKAGALLSGMPDCIIVNSFAGKKFHSCLGYSRAKWAVIHNGVDCEKFKPLDRNKSKIRQELGIPETDFVIALVARFDPMKDHENFFTAAKILLETNPEVHFILAGRGVDQQNLKIKQYMSPINQKGNIHLLGERNDINNIYAVADIASSSSYGEGFPNVIAEAMAAGIPCVVTDAGDSSLIAGKTGFVVPVKDPEALASAWQHLIDASAEYVIKLGRMAEDRVKKRFDFNNAVERYENLWLNSIS
jgi:glycosyltransferase involved in cell wall biosynthesis